jgi:hypothetical protein
VETVAPPLGDDAAAVGRPPRPGEVARRIVHQETHRRARPARHEVHQPEGAAAGRVDHTHDPSSVRRHIRVGRAGFLREADDRTTRSRHGVEVRIDRHRPHTLELIEHDPVAAHGRASAVNAPRQAPRGPVGEPHQRRKPVGVRRPVVHGAVGANPRSGDDESVVRQAAGRLIRHTRHEGRSALVLVPEVAPQRSHGRPERRRERARAQQGEPASRRVGQRFHACRPETVRQVLMEVRAVRIRGVAVRPVVETAAGAIDRLEQPPARRHVDERAKVPGGDPALTRHPTLLERREPFDLPGRQEEIGEHQRRASEDPAHAAHEAPRSIEMQDVRVLVGERDLQPVGRVADRFLTRRRHGGDLDRIVWKRVRPAVRHVGLIDEDHLHPAARHPERRLELRAQALRDRGEPARQRVLALVGVDVEVRGPVGAETETRIVPVRRRRQDRREQEQQRRDATARSSGRHPSGT